MKENLVIVESPAKAKTIQRYLSKGFLVRYCLGHIMDLPKSRMGIEIENNFKPHYVIIPGKRKIVNALKKEINDKESLYLASDPDREGEAISWHLKKILGKDRKTYRVIFHEITPEAIKEAFKNPQDIDLNKVDAQQARRVLDRILGYNLSPLLWKKVSRGLSAGRVQSVALRLIVEREKEIQKFLPQEYWEIEAELSKLAGGKTFKAKLIKIKDKKPELKNQSQANEIIEKLKTVKFIVITIEEKEKKQNPSPPFTTSTLQQEAFNRLKFSANKTMLIAQQLYEGLEVGEGTRIGLITYMRTDSVRIALPALNQIREFILKEFGSDYLSPQPNIYKNKSLTQEAHEAIRPTSVYRTPESLKSFITEDQYKLYELIWKRTLGSQMKPLTYLLKTVDIKARDCLFRMSGKKIICSGFTILFPEVEEKFLPELKESEELKLINLIASQHFTKPPARYNDGSLVKAMEEKGIGRPSTYAPTIQTLILRDYVRRKGGQLLPTELGFLVTDLLTTHFPKIIDLGFTANIEEELDKIETGRIKWHEVVRDFYQPFQEQLKVAHERMRNVKKETQETKEICQLCGRRMVIRWGRKGRFLSCLGFPECKNTRPITTGLKCPKEGCPGELVEKRNKRGKIFYGCSRYPACNFATNKLPL